MMSPMVVVHQAPVMLRRKVVKMRPNLMQPQNKPEKMDYNKVQKEPTKENKMLNKPQAKVQENPAAKEVPKEAARVQAKAKALEKVDKAKALEAEKEMAEKVKALEKVGRVKKEAEMVMDKAKAKVEIHPRIQEVPRMHPEILEMLEVRLMK